MDASQPWLAFSLSHRPPHLLQAFHGDLSFSVGGDHEGGVHGASCVALMVAEAPKLEDFLGGASSGDHPLGGGYDSDLRSIAAGFRRASPAKQQPAEAEPKTAKVAETFGQRTSIFRGVTRWTGRYEAHLWDNSCRREGQSRKGRQVYLGGYDKEEKAARAYDLAALKYWGSNTSTNFPVTDYEMELEEMKNMTRQEFIALLRRRSSGFSRGASIYRGVTKHHQHGRWQARIGRVAGNKDLYLGTFGTQEEAAEAYDIAAIKFRGLGAVTNFEMSRYDVDSILNSDLPVGGGGGAYTKVASSRASDPPPPLQPSASSSSPATAPALARVSTHSFSSTLTAQHQELFSPLLALNQEQQQQWTDQHRRHQHHHQVFESFKSGSTVDFAAAGSNVVGELALGQGREGSSLSGSAMPQEHGPTATQFYYLYNQETKHGLAAFHGALYGME